MDRVSIILGRWPDGGVLARDLGVPYRTLASWRRRRRIPPEYWRPVVAAARKRRLPGVTLDTLLDALIEAGPQNPTPPRPDAAPEGVLSDAAAQALAQNLPPFATRKRVRPGT